MWAALGRGAAGLRVFGSRLPSREFLLLVRGRYNLIPNLYLYKQLLYIGALMVEAVPSVSVCVCVCVCVFPMHPPSEQLGVVWSSGTVSQSIVTPRYLFVCHGMHSSFQSGPSAESQRLPEDFWLKVIGPSIHTKPSSAAPLIKNRKIPQMHSQSSSLVDHHAAEQRHSTAPPAGPRRFAALVVSPA